MSTQHNRRVPLGVIYYNIKRMLLTNLHYYQQICFQDFTLSWSISSPWSFKEVLATLLQTLKENYVAKIDAACDHL